MPTPTPNDCRCKICRNDLRETVGHWRSQNNDDNAIRQQLATKGVVITQKALARHFENVETTQAVADIDNAEDAAEATTEPTTAPAARTQSVKPRTRTVKTQVFQPVGERFGADALNTLSLEDYDFDEDDPVSIVRYIQQKNLVLYLQQMQIVADEQQRYLSGDAKRPPSTSISHLRTLFDLTNRVTGISVYANQQAAIKTVQRMGLRVEEFIGIKSIPQDDLTTTPADTKEQQSKEAADLS